MATEKGMLGVNQSLRNKECMVRMNWGADSILLAKEDSYWYVPARCCKPDKMPRCRIPPVPLEMWVVMTSS